jgi:hypothetical protein
MYNITVTVYHWDVNYLKNIKQTISEQRHVFDSLNLLFNIDCATDYRLAD